MSILTKTNCDGQLWSENLKLMSKMNFVRITIPQIYKLANKKKALLYNMAPMRNGKAGIGPRSGSHRGLLHLGLLGDLHCCHVVSVITIGDKLITTSNQL